MFGINDNKTAGQDPVMPEPLESPESEAGYGSTSGAGTAPPLASNPPVLVPSPTAAPGQPQSYPPVMQPPTVPPDNAAVGDNSADELLQIKQQALHSLAPLVGHLDQTPEEKFKTTMMMLQASDNPQLVKEAYAAANEITDEKAHAQALLDVVNEINYFTHHDAS